MSGSATATRGGFYASQDADYSMDDDGDYFTWTLEETKAVLDEDEAPSPSVTTTFRKSGTCTTIRPRMCCIFGRQR